MLLSRLCAVVRHASSRTIRMASTASKRESSRWSLPGLLAAAAAATFGVTAVGAVCERKRFRRRKSGSYPEGMPEGHRPRPDLPTFKIADIKKHTTPEDGMWVTFKGGVYDITEFMSGHPGGNDRLMMAAGNDLSIFWDIYRMHFKKDVFNFMERYRIGNLKPADALKMETEFVFEDPYINDPKRHPDLLATIARPFCGEARLGSDYGKDFYTSNDLCYVRLHLPVPDIDPDDWEVVVTGNGLKEHTFNLKFLKENFKHHTFACTLQCAGNRREDFNRDGKTVMISPHWRVTAFSNAKYTGVYLRDVLEYCGFDVDAHHLAETPLDPNIRHVEFEGTDATEGGTQYGVSIPIEKAVDPRGDVILAWEMNDEPLPRDHGGPVRMLCPGYVGNKSCKFIETISVQKGISMKPWHYHAYRNFPPDITFEDDLSKWATVDLEKGPICYKMPVQSIICEPAAVAKVGAKGRTHVTVKGMAWTGNGVGMSRVDVSLDGGETWTAADFLDKPADVTERETDNRKWSWYQFKKDIPIPEHMLKDLAAGKDVEIELVSKGVDGAFNVQPERFGPYYNARGCVVNQMYRIPMTLKANWSIKKSEAVQGEDAENPPTGGHYKKPWDYHGWSTKLAKDHEKLVPEAMGGRSVHRD